MTSHRREDAPETSSPEYAFAQIGSALAGIGLIGWVVIVYVASEIFDWSGGQIFGFAVGVALIIIPIALAIRVIRLIVIGKWN